MQRKKSIISLLVILSLSIFTCSVLYFTFMSFVGMFNLQFSNQTDSPIKSSIEFDNQFSMIPPINGAAIPLAANKAVFLLSEGKDSEARKALKDASRVNPYIGFSDFVLSNFHYASGNIDSAQVYGERAFKLWPKSLSNFDMVNKVYAYQGDTLSILKSYIDIKDFFKHRTEYYDSFIKYYSLAKYSYYDVEYNDLVSISSEKLIGEWVRVNNRKDGGIMVQSKTRIEFLSNGFFKSNGKFYLYNKEEDNVLISFQDNPDNILSSFVVQYSPKWNTLVLKFEDLSEEKVQLFRKTSELDLEK